MIRSAPPVFGANVCGLWGAEREYEDGTSVTHWAYDLCAPKGTPALSLLPGTVVDRVWSKHGGNQLVMQWGKGIFVRYSHLERIYPRVGSPVRAFETVALVGNTGVNARGNPITSHLHFQMMDRYSIPYVQGSAEPIDMPKFLRAHGIEIVGRGDERILAWKDGWPRVQAGGLLTGLAALSLSAGAAMMVGRGDRP